MFGHRRLRERQFVDEYGCTSSRPCPRASAESARGLGGRGLSQRSRAPRRRPESSTGAASRSSARELSGGQQAAGSGGGCERLRFEVADIVYRRLTISMPKPTRPIERMRAIRDSRLLDASAAAHPSHLFASAPPRRLDGADVDLLHRHHRLEGASVFFGFMLVCSLCAIRADAAVSRRMHRANSPSGVVRRGSWLSAQAFFQRSRARCPGIRSPRSETALMRCPSPRAAGRA